MKKKRKLFNFDTKFLDQHHIVQENGWRLPLFPLTIKIYVQVKSPIDELLLQQSASQKLDQVNLRALKLSALLKECTVEVLEIWSTWPTLKYDSGSKVVSHDTSVWWISAGTPSTYKGIFFHIWLACILNSLFPITKIIYQVKKILQHIRSKRASKLL